MGYTLSSFSIRSSINEKLYTSYALKPDKSDHVYSFLFVSYAS